MTLKRIRLILLLRLSLISISLITLAACSTSPLKATGSSVSQPEPIVAEPITAAAMEKPKLRDFDLDQDTMYDLLVAEIAAQRGQFDITLLNYIQQARSTRDPDIIKRAINAAQYSRDLEAIQELALLWAEVEPNNIHVHQLLAFQYSLQKMYAEAIKHIDVILQLGGDARVDSLAIGSKALPAEDQTALLGLYQELYNKYPNNDEVGYSLALIQRTLQKYDEALATLAPVLKRSPQFEPAMVLHANTLYDKGELKQAIDYANKQFAKFPQNHNLGRLYASMLIEDKQLDAAEKVFSQLIELYPQATTLRLSHALVSLENHKVEIARQELQALLDEGVHQNEANFYLGRIADSEKNYPKAIEYYSQIQEGAHFEPALERSSFLLSQQGKTPEAVARLADLRAQRPELALNLWILQYKLLAAINDDGAMDTLNQAIQEFPDNEQLLYARAMDYEQQDNLAAMEADLRAIIKADPKNAIAINALGYTLADRTDRLEEAFLLIRQALSLKPDNPAILDSMGWVLYRLGKNEEAVLLLLKAFQSYPDAEVAAHLGEVLWVLGKQADARVLWQKVLEKTPDHKVLIKTLQRFAPDLLPAHGTESETSKNSATGDS